MKKDTSDARYVQQGMRCQFVGKPGKAQLAAEEGEKGSWSCVREIRLIIGAFAGKPSGRRAARWKIRRRKTD